MEGRRRRRTHKDVGPDLSELLRVGESVEDVVLDLEVLSHRHEDRECQRVRGLVSDTGLQETTRRKGQTRETQRKGAGLGADHSHGEGDGEVEGVESGLVDDNEVVPTRKRGNASWGA